MHVAVWNNRELVDPTVSHIPASLTLEGLLHEWRQGERLQQAALLLMTVSCHARRSAK